MRPATAPPPPAVLRVLACPDCGGALEPAGDALVCASGHALSIHDGYVDARPDRVDATTAATFASFGYEWTTFSQLGPDDERFWDGYMDGVPFDRVRDDIALDAGCGMGRYSLLTARRVSHLVALDGSDAVHAAVTNLSGSPNVTVVRADLRDAPFVDGAFGLVTSLGVLHHLAEPERGFARLARLLRPGGVLVVYLYSRPAGPSVRSVALGAAALLRRLSLRVPHALLRWLSAPIGAVLYLAVVVPGAVGASRGWGRLAALPLAPYRGRSWRVLWLDTFDRLSAPVEHRFVWDDVAPWFDRAGLHVLSVRDFGGLVIVAERPA